MTKKVIKLTIRMSLLNCFLFSTIFGCRYNVREIGFADLAFAPYQLYLYVGNNTPTYYKDTFRRISYAVLLDANIEVEIVNLDEQPDHPAMTYYNFWKSDSLPIAIIVSAEAQSMLLPLSSSRKQFKEAVWSMLEKTISSPVRAEIIKNIIKAYAVVLFIHGENNAKNKAALEKVVRAIEEISKIMKQMPKPIDAPPKLIEITQKSVSEEKILLWSLGLSEKGGEEPLVAILYGRGRRMGPLMIGEQITENTIFNLLSLVGADCECGLDRSWMLGMRIPLRWSSKVQTELVKRLGFDVENPMVKAEMSHILSLAVMLGNRSKQSSNFQENNLYGYRERQLEFETQTDVPKLSLSQLQDLNSPESASPGSSAIRIGLYAIGVIFLITIAGGTFIILRARKRQF